MNFILKVGEGRVQSIISYNQLLDFMARSKQDDEGVYKFKRIIAHQGLLKPGHYDWKESKYNLLIEWESGEQTYTPLSIIADDDLLLVPYTRKKTISLMNQGGNVSNI